MKDTMINSYYYSYDYLCNLAGEQAIERWINESSTHTGASCGSRKLQGDMDIPTGTHPGGAGRGRCLLIRKAPR